ncbi:MAG: arylesterase [Acidobacteria bacterium]|nr:arylesterase [Acidobacteriota bacterium]
MIQQRSHNRNTRTSNRQSWMDGVKSNPVLTAAVMIVLVGLVWMLWPQSFSHVENLDSRGSEIIAFGDSLTAGYGAGAGDDYPSKLSAMTGIAIANAGVSGDTTESALKRLDHDVLDGDPRIVIVGLGGNDYLRSVPLSTTEANLRTIIDRIQNRGAMVVLLGFRFPSLNANYGAMYERVAEEEGVLFIPDMLDGILGDPSLKSDSIHPNARGYEIMAERVSGPFTTLVRKADTER